MLNNEGNICEYDGYKMPKQGEDTPENRELREKAMNETKKWIKEVIKEYSE